jgi:hypothetical protein
MSNSVQLEMFKGEVLTEEQQRQVESFIDTQVQNAELTQEKASRIMLLLDEAGFVQNENYKNTTKVEEVTKEVTLGYNYNNTNFNIELTYLETSGGVVITYDRIKNDKLVKDWAKVYVDRNNKLECSSITPQYRYYKPSTLLEKLNDHNAKQASQLERNNKEKIAIDYTIKKYQKLYPNAEVKEGSGYDRYSSNNHSRYSTVEVEFESGSSVTFRLGYGYELDKERVVSSYDAQSESISQKLDRFNNQKVK